MAPMLPVDLSLAIMSIIAITTRTTTIVDNDIALAIFFNASTKIMRELPKEFRKGLFRSSFTLLIEQS